MNAGEQVEAVSYARDIRPLFRQRDIDAMSRRLKLDSYDEVSGRAEDILDRLEGGNMPCDGAWPDEQIALFRKWIADGRKP